jgi:hypothetical protein
VGDVARFVGIVVSPGASRMITMKGSFSPFTVKPNSTM